MRRHHLIVASKLSWIYLFVGEGSLEQVWIAAQMPFEQIDAATVQSHRRRIRQFEPVLDIEFQNAMLGRWIAAVGLEHCIYRRNCLSSLVIKAGATCDKGHRALN